MLNDYTGKEVRVIVSSGSGASAISAGERYCNGIMISTINLYGIIRRIDDKFIELEDTRYTLYSLETEKPIGLNYPININVPVFESEKTLISIDKIISLSLI